jgi:hypothetical protein
LRQLSDLGHEVKLLPPQYDQEFSGAAASSAAAFRLLAFWRAILGEFLFRFHRKVMPPAANSIEPHCFDGIGRKPFCPA